MPTNLENYIKMNRDQFETFSPSDAVWAKLNVSLAKPAVVASKLSWLKYFGFGASVIAVAVYLKVNSEGNQEQQPTVYKQQTIAALPIQNEEPSMVKQVASGAVVLPKNALVVTPWVFTQSIPSEVPTVETIGYKNVDETLVSYVQGADIENNQSGGGASSNATGSEEANSYVVDTSFTGIKTLEINCSSFDVDVKAIGGNQVLFKANMTTQVKGIVRGKNLYKTLYQLKDSTLTITIVSDEKMKVLGTCNTQNPVLNFDVPFITNVIVSDSYGNVSADGLQGSIFKLIAKSGNVKVSNITSKIEVQATYGDVSIINIKGDLMTLVNSGNLSVTNATGNVNAKSVYGDQKFKDIVGNIKTSNNSGDVKIKNLKGNIEMECIYGSVRLEDCVGNLTINAISGDISGKNVELLQSMSTTSKYGNVDVQLVNELSSLSFDLKTTYGEISIDKNGEQMNSDNVLLIDKGKILVKGITNSGDQSYK